MELKIDTERHLHGAEVASELRGERSGGIPWMLITDSSGAELVTSDGPQGNVGCPVMPHETEWFLSMLDRTRQRLSAPTAPEVLLSSPPSPSAGASAAS